MLLSMTISKRILILSTLILTAIQLAACGIATPAPTVTVTTAPSLTSSSPSPISATTPSPTNTLTATAEPNISPNCTIVNKAGKLYILSEKEFFAFGPSEKELDQALANNYPEWANFEQSVSWYSEPVKLGKIVEAASFQEQYYFNPAATLVTLGESLNWQLPSDGDLYLQSLAISERLVHSAFEWIKPENEYIRTQYPEVSNGATYALYVFFNYDKEKLQVWCYTYQRLFGTSS